MPSRLAMMLPIASVPDAGFYALSALAILTTTPANNVTLEILLNGTTAIASNTNTGIDAISCSSMHWLPANSLISVRMTQNSGGAVTLAGSATSESNLSIMKLVDA